MNHQLFPVITSEIAARYIRQARATPNKLRAQIVEAIAKLPKNNFDRRQNKP